MSTYYIDPQNGSNSNSGTSVDDAYETFEPLHHDASPPGPGDTIKVRDTADVTQGTIGLYRVQGSASNPIVIEPYEDESPVLEIRSGRGFFLNGTQHLTIRGLEILGASDGIKVQNGGDQQARGVVIEDCNIHNCAANAIIVSSGTHDVTIRGCELHHNSETENGDGLRVTEGVQSVEVRNTVAHHNADDGYDALDVEASGDYLFADCLAYHNGLDGDGTGFKIGRWDLSKDPYPTGGARLYRCAAYGQTGQGAMGFRISDARTDLVNCTAAENEGRGFMLKSGAGTQSARNCLSWTNAQNVYQSGGIDESNNSWQLDLGDPKFVSTDPADDGFLRLQDGSPCIGTGTSDGLPDDYDGDGSDLGAFPFGGTGGGTTEPEPDPEPTLPRLIVFDGDATTERTTYGITVSGEMVKDAEHGTIDDSDEITADGRTASGTVWSGTDAYQFSGDITAASFTGDVSNLVVRVDGAEQPLDGLVGAGGDDTGDVDDGTDGTGDDTGGSKPDEPAPDEPDEPDEPLPELCQGITSRGKPCKKPAGWGTDSLRFCMYHEDQADGGSGGDSGGGTAPNHTHDDLQQGLSALQAQVDALQEQVSAIEGDGEAGDDSGDRDGSETTPAEIEQTLDDLDGRIGTLEQQVSTISEHSQ